jgi:hypothetical protein
MKFILTSIIGLLITISSFAQITPGSYVLGGGLGFGYSKTPNTTSESQSTSFRISPGIGKFISEKHLIDGGVEYSFNTRSLQSQSDYFQKNTTHFAGIRFGLTKYIPIIDQLYFTVGAHAIPSYSTTLSESTISGSATQNTTSTVQARLNIAPGLTYFINKKWMLYTYVGVLNYGLKYNLTTEKIGHNLYLNLQSNSFGVGARYVIGKGTSE